MPRLSLLALALVPALGLAAPTLPEAAVTTAERLRDDALADNPAYRLVSSLTTEVGPRMAGSDAEPRAVAWAIARMKQLGFDRVWTEPVEFPQWTRRHESAAVLGAHAQPLSITALGGSVGTGGALEAGIVRFASLDALKAAPADSLTGRIAFVDKHMQRFRDGHDYGATVDARVSGASEAARRGAVALLIRSVGTDRHRMPHTGVLHYADDAAKIPAAALSNPDADQLARLLALGEPVTVSLDLDVGGDGTVTGYNVIGEITGREQPDEVVVIGGHLDSWDLGTGAIDDGAGVAITMAAGSEILALPERPRRSIRVIAFANEERGLFGGKAYAAQHTAELPKHVLGAESDFGAGRIYALSAGVDAASRPLIERIAGVLAPLDIERGQAEDGAGPDIGPMSEQGVPWAELQQDGTDYFDYHHTADDTLDKIDPKALDQQVAAYAVLAWMAAEADGRITAPAKAAAAP